MNIITTQEIANGGPPRLGPKSSDNDFLSLADDWTHAALGLEGVPVRSEPDNVGSEPRSEWPRLAGFLL